jgi:hypothetical protein
VPPGVVTVTSTAPAGPGGTTAVIWVEETMVKEDASAVPKRTAVAPDRLVPVRVTVFPP